MLRIRRSFFATTEGRNADRHRHGPRRGMLRDARPDALGERGSVDRVGPRRENRELVAAPPRAGISLAQLRANDRGDFAQRIAAGTVAVAIVDVLQPVYVEKEQAERLAVAFSAYEFGMKTCRKPAGVQQPGKGIGLGELRQLVGLPSKYVSEQC